ncbi:MAG: hypothetical protein J5614_09695 [Paludibacteraceae bacterium]|nr:hypothetical protein [Paludibacteraceae bacterium]
MLEYIKQQLQAMNPAPQEDAIQEQLMDEAVLDCAHLFQEFDDLTMNGTITNGPRQFANVDIPLADDIEITSVELNLLDNRVVDVPMDATVQEAVDLGLMKTFEDFYQEAFSSNTPFGRESIGVFEDRCRVIAENEFQKYRDYLIQEGLFGFDKISINDPRVPAKVQLCCGNRKGEKYVMYLDVFFAVDKKSRITRKQLESINIFQQVSGTPEMGESLQKTVFEMWGAMCECSSADDIWEHVTPSKLKVPIDPADSYCVALEFEFEDFDTTKMLYWHVPIKKGTKGVTSAKEVKFKQVSSDKINAEHMISKKEGKKILKEAAEWKPRELSRFGSNYYQEGIDFGDADAPPSTDADNSGVSFGNGDAAPDANAGGVDAAVAPPAEGDAGGQPKEVADGNDVSKDIAEKVADDTQAATADDGLSVDGVDDATADADVSDLDNTDTPTEEDVNADLGDVDENSVDTGDEANATSDVDVDNMTPEELKAAAADKIEKMTFQQIKDFLNNGEGTTGDELPEGDEGVQEAFFLTRGNIGKELDIHLRRTLGILNDSEMEIGVLCSKFRKQGKRLNHVVHKASKMKDVFNEGEIKQLLKLNALLSDLMAMMRADLDPQGVQAVKRLIKAFVQQATGVAKLVEQKQPGKPVQEGFFDRLLGKPSGVKLPTDHSVFVQSHKYEDFKNVTVEDESGTVIIQRFLSYDEINKYYERLKNSNLSVKSPHGWTVTDMIPVAIANSDPEDSSRGFIDYIVLVPDKEGVPPSVYCTLDMRTSEGTPALFSLARNLTDLLKLIEYHNKGAKSTSDIDYIESKTGIKLPEGFKKLYESKKYQALVGKTVKVYDEPDRPDWDNEYTIFGASGIISSITDIDDDEAAELLNGFIEFGMLGDDDSVAYCDKDGRVYMISSFVDPPSLLDQYKNCEEFIDKLYKAMNERSES